MSERSVRSIRTQKPVIPKHHQWNQSFSEFESLQVPEQLRQELCLSIVSKERLIETMLRQYNARRCIVGVALGEEHIALSFHSVKSTVSKADAVPYPNVLGEIYFEASAHGLRPLTKYETYQVSCAPTDAFTHRRLRPGEIEAISVARTVFKAA